MEPVIVAGDVQVGVIHEHRIRVEVTQGRDGLGGHLRIAIVPIVADVADVCPRCAKNVLVDGDPIHDRDGHRLRPNHLEPGEEVRVPLQPSSLERVVANVVRVHPDARQHARPPRATDSDLAGQGQHVPVVRRAGVD